jgi:uncharacterized repeat protein (TIGR03803 family)
LLNPTGDNMKSGKFKLNQWKSASAVFLFCAATVIASPGQIFTTLASLEDLDGINPGVLSQGTNGNFYGVAGSGGKYGRGTAFEVASNGKLTVLYNFCPQTYCADGEFPEGLMQASNGNFYGVTTSGGLEPNHLCRGYVVGFGCGTVFKITPGGKETLLHDFCLQEMCADGQGPGSMLVQGVNGNLYGVTFAGGNKNSTLCVGVNSSCGTIFEIAPSGQFTTVYNFCSQPRCADGSFPDSLIQSTDGNLYGTAAVGGAYNRGTFFLLTPTGILTTLDSFTWYGGGAPTFSVQATDGNFYGTISTANTTGGGSVVKITPSGELSTLYSFCAEPCIDGAGPGALLQGADGNFYGITAYGGSGTNCGRGECGTIFEVTPAGQLTTLYNFCTQANCNDGRGPSSLIQGTDGSFYGTTQQGGCSNGKTGCGTVFSLSVGLGPFVKSNPAFGKVGYNMNILGNNLTGATGVTFNGTPAAFTVVSNSYIKAMVPVGATTGTIQVTTPNGTLSSNVAFRILP